MQNVIVVNNIKDWELNLPDVEVISAKTYLTDSQYADARNIRVCNLCRSYRYQGLGYYVSLLAEARGQRVMPSIRTIQDLKAQAATRIISEDLDHLIQTSLHSLKSDSFDLSIYFGRNIAKHYDNLCKQLYNLLQAPLFKAHFVFNKKWLLQQITPISITEIPEHHKTCFAEFAEAYFAKKRFRGITIPNRAIYDLAILVNPIEETPPSNKKALQYFTEAGANLGFNVRMVTKDDIARIPEFDALFIRETTNVNHHTYRIARRADAAGLVVIDDPKSILRCANKVYLAELLNKNKIPTPKTMVVHKDNCQQIEEFIGLPCILKQPDSAFSQGVIKVADTTHLQSSLNEFFSTSDLIIAQEFTPSDFDWRIGILDKQPLFACKYYMAKNHWQIYDWKGKGNNSKAEGVTEALPIEEVPVKVLETAIRAANLIGDGLYGVDLKVYDDKVLVIEINDNPSVEYGFEDTVLKENLYIKIMQSILNRIESKREKSTNGK